MAKGAVLTFRTSSAAETGASNSQNESASSALDVTDSLASPVVAPSVAHHTQTATIQNVGGGRVFVFPLYVSVEGAGIDFTASSNDLGLVGEGESQMEALDDLRDQVRELYESLDAMRAELGPLMLEHLAFLDRLAGRES